MIKREFYLKKIRPFMGTDLIKVLTGLRRCGKSVLLEQIKEELLGRGAGDGQFICLNFEDARTAHLRTAEALHDEIAKRASGLKGKLYLFFDEIEAVDEWERALASFRVEFDCDIYVAGSCADLLSGGHATYLAGRYVAFKICPFSFAEFVKLYQTCHPDADEARCFKEYLTQGGMPFLAKLDYDAPACKQYLWDLCNGSAVKDMIKRHQIRDVDLLERIISCVLTNLGKPLSASFIAKVLKGQSLKTSAETVSSCLKACAEACLFCEVRRQDLRSKKILTTHAKHYLADHGIRQAVFEDNLDQIDLVMENIVCLELLRRGYDVTAGKLGEQEIDFLGEKGASKVYVQVASLLADDDTKRREFGVFYRIKDNFPKYVVTIDEYQMSRDGFKHRNIRDFLLQDVWN